MDVSAWVLYTSITVLVLTASVLHYRWREPGGRGRILLGLLRGAALALMVLLLFDPVVRSDAGDRPVVALVDASLSMTLVDEEGTRRWAEAVAAVAAAAPDRVVLFGATEQPVAEDLDEVQPRAPRSRLAPALRNALEAAPSRVVVVTDGAIEDGAEVRRVAGRAGVPLDVRLVGGRSRANLAVESVRAPSWLEVGEPAVMRVVVERAGGSEPALPDSVRVTVSRNATELAGGQVAVPGRGGSAALELVIRPDSAASGPVRLDVRVEPGGAVAGDDVRSLYVRVAEEPAGVTLVSFRPDQEPRFLVPVLERALGLPVRGWIAVGRDRFISVATGPEAGATADPAAVQRALAGATLVVLHGLSAEAPDWARQLADDAGRALLFPADPVPGLPVSVGPVRSGDWYLSPELPSSPVAALLVGIEPEPVPPLTGLRAVEAAPGYWAPLEARLGRRGGAAPVLVAGRDGSRRVAVALGTGYWRWAFAGGAGRDTYDRLWSAVAGWLMEEAVGVDPEPVRPVDRVVARGEPVRWLAPGDSLRVTVFRDTDTAGSGESVLDTTVLAESGRATTPALEPGHYRYAARVEDRSVEGAFTVESYSPEFVAEPAALELAGGEGVAPRSRGYGRPLHTTAWPYVLIAAMLCLEWALRRRWGLR